jgi:heterodisulfide reductase subunit A
LKADAILVTSGFSPYDPTEKPYGYGRFPNVVTNLDAEKILQQWDSLIRPSDGKIPRRIAFVQCVGSRDIRIGHPWCSRICCGSALRMANLVLHRHPDTAITFFYIDVQTFGKDFQLFYDQIRDRIRMIRVIPGDIVADANDQLQVAYFDPQTHSSIEEPYDLAVLSVGLRPSSDNTALADMFGLGLTQYGFLRPQDPTSDSPRGVFAAGSLLGPMSIAESIDSAGQAAWEIVSFFQEEPANG